MYADLAQWKSVRSMDKKPCDNNVETVYARGGRGNAKIVGFSSNREARLVMQDAIFDNKAVAMLTGNDLLEGKKIVDINEVQSVTSNKITLNKTPKGALVSVFKVNPDGTNGDEFTLGTPTTNPKEYSISGKDLTFGTTVANGTLIRVYYKIETATDAKSIKVTSDQFGKTFRVSIEVLVTDVYTKKAYNGILNIPNAKFEDNFNISLSSDGDPAVLDLNMEILKSPVSQDMWELIVFDLESAV